MDEFIADMQGWLSSRAARLCQSPTARSRIDDVMQEGRITLWRTYAETGSTEEACARAHWRMKDVAWGDDPLHTGAEPRERFTLQHKPESVDALLEAGISEAFSTVEGLSDVEWAYHHGEIMAAIAALTPKQRTYIYARFWCGMDPTDGLNNNPGMREARAANPLLKRDILWTGSKATPGAKKRLAATLAHLEGLVSA